MKMEIRNNELLKKQALRAAIEPARGGSGQDRSEARTWERGAGAPLLRFSVYFCACLTLAVLIFMIGYILVKGVPFLRGDLFSWKYTSENCSVVPALVNTLIMTLLALLIACPLGIGSAIYLVEYAGKGNRFVKIVRMTTETLTGIPSIIYGLFGMLLFVGFLHWGYSLMAGAATVAIMILPTIMRTTEEALLAVPDSFREGSFGLVAGKIKK